MPEHLKGVFVKSTDIDPTNRQTVHFSKLYKRGEGKDLTDDMKRLFLKSKTDHTTILQRLKGLKRVPVPVKTDGECFFTSILIQLNCPKEYTSILFRRQIALHAVKYFDVFEDDITPYLEGSNYESFARNIFYGYSHGTVAESIIITHLWNVRITFVAAELGRQTVFHDGKTTDIVLLHNGREGCDGHFSGTSKLYDLDIL